MSCNRSLNIQIQTRNHEIIVCCMSLHTLKNNCVLEYSCHTRLYIIMMILSQHYHATIQLITSVNLLKPGYLVQHQQFCCNCPNYRAAKTSILEKLVQTLKYCTLGWVQYATSTYKYHLVSWVQATTSPSSQAREHNVIPFKC